MIRTRDDRSCEDVCAIAWKGYKADKGAGRKDQTGRGHGIVEKELMNGRVPEDVTEARKEARRAPRAANLIGTLTGLKEVKAKGRVKPDTAKIAREQGHTIWAEIITVTNRK